jgi:hypothetical protein
MMDDAKGKRSWDSVTRNWSYLMALCTSPIFILYVILGDTGRGRAAWLSAMMIALVARYFWDLRNRVWFWVAIVVIVLVHVPLIVLVPWSSKHLTYVALLPLGLLDIAFAYGIIRLVENSHREK